MLRVHPLPYPEADRHSKKEPRVQKPTCFLIFVCLLQVDVGFLHIAHSLRRELIDKNALILLIIYLHLKLLKHLRKLKDHILS